MKLDHLLYSPGLYGNALTKPYVNVNFYFQKKIALASNKVTEIGFQVAKLVSSLFLGCLALVGMAIKFLDFHLRVKVSPGKPLEDPSTLGRAFDDMLTGKTLTAQNVYEAHKQGIDFSRKMTSFTQTEERQLGKWLLHDFMRLNSPDNEQDLSDKDLAVVSAFIRCGAEIDEDDLVRTSRGEKNLELLRLLIANCGTQVLTPDTSGRIFRAAANSNSLDKMIFVHGLNLGIYTPTTDIGLRTDEMNQFLRKIGALEKNG